MIDTNYCQRNEAVELRKVAFHLLIRPSLTIRQLAGVGRKCVFPKRKIDSSDYIFLSPPPPSFAGGRGRNEMSATHIVCAMHADVIHPKCEPVFVGGPN